MKTYEEILSSMTEKYEELSGFKPQKASDVYMKFQVLSGELYALLASLEWAKRQMFTETATGEYLDRHAESRGIVRKKAKKAMGTVTFMLMEEAIFDVEIPKGTVVSTLGDEPLRFETLKDAKIPTGAFQIMVDAVALTPGKASNVRENTIELLVTTVAGVERVTNADPFMGGEDKESDGELRNRIAESLKFPSTGANASYYKNLALSVDGVTGASVVPNARGVGTVDVYVSTLNGEYDDYELNAVQNALDEGRQVNIDAKAVGAQPLSVNVSLSVEVKAGYSFSQVQENCEKAVTDYIASVGVGGKVLLTEMGERIYHTPGVKEYLFSSAMRDVICENTRYPKAGVVTVSEGIVR